MMPIEEAVYISELFDIRTTDNSGRACFASKDLKKGTDVLCLTKCLGASTCYEFRKEVCSQCFQYDGGQRMKVRLNNKFLKGAGLWFCTENCRDQFLRQEHVDHLIDALETLLVSWEIQAKKRIGSIDRASNSSISTEKIESLWQDIRDNWITRIDRMKPTKRVLQLPIINEDEYVCARFVIHCLFTLKTTDTSSLHMAAFRNLQSNESSKISRFPVLLDLQKRVFQTLYILLPPFLKSGFDIPTFRHILGSEYGNSFGIWQNEEASDSREYLGYWVLPEASFFNHSCAPNLIKHRFGNKMIFTLNSDVTKDQELCIDYKDILDLKVDERRHILKENWFFSCECPRCKIEMQIN
ncbi:Set6p [Lachancea thermotolerans CBS 6340]|uniref:KLTH0D11638p n=1 Tax=Lachancea thermotolerans (strain ATCC 56472 / CBS 6340 / NRRL Y-8284) TaxID=559295 RepID=C5DF23_LACTC|nr:KLTH0D11638p [Lachancea thermotolerans CBS 6340]CAR22778.1 KLTH0D11638p [Lachancea thermotolerans CBS 6340]